MLLKPNNNNNKMQGFQHFNISLGYTPATKLKTNSSTSSHSSPTSNGADVVFNPETAIVPCDRPNPSTGEMIAPSVVKVGLKDGGWCFSQQFLIVFLLSR